MPSLPKVLLVDGHSMIFASDVLRARHQKSGADARRILIGDLLRYQDNSGIHVVIVFDGRGARTASDPEENRIQVFYSKSGQTADAVIERLVAKYSSTHQITVATDDHMERTTVTTFGAEWISSSTLARQIQESETELRETLDAVKKQNSRKRR